MKSMTYDEVSVQDAAWLAGFFDGEGTVHFWNHRASYKHNSWILEIALGNTHAPSIERLVSLVRCGRVQVLDKKPHKTLYLWKATSLAAEGVLRLIRPYSVTKAQQIDLALSAVLLRKSAPRERGCKITEETREKLRSISNEIKLVRAS